MNYLNELSAELAAVGIVGSRRRRILAEVDDHLQESRDVAGFGSPALVAQRFADELASTGARRVGIGAVLALVPAGLVFVALFAFNGPSADIASAHTLAIGLPAAALMLLAPQVALAAGLLAVLRVHARRGADVLPAAEVRVLRRRAAVALSAGAIALLAAATYALEYRAGLPSWWVATALVAAGVAMVPVVVAAGALRATSRLEPRVGGPAGEIADDLGVRAAPWHVCLVVAALSAIGALVAGGPDEGPRNAIAEFVAVCAGFAVLGRFLGLRR
jgi:hypothetical protein